MRLLRPLDSVFYFFISLIQLYHYHKLFVGSDYKGTERFNRYEKELGEKGVEIVYFPYTQGTSSTQLRKTIHCRTKETEVEKS